MRIEDWLWNIRERRTFSGFTGSGRGGGQKRNKDLVFSSHMGYRVATLYNERLKISHVVGVCYSSVHSRIFLDHEVSTQ